MVIWLASSRVGARISAWHGNLRPGSDALYVVEADEYDRSFLTLSPTVAVSGVMLFLSGISLIGVFTMVNSLVQLIVTNDMRGRVMSVYNFAFRGGMPFGNLLTGLLVPIYTAPLVLAVNGVLLVLVGLYYFTVQRKVAAL